MLLARSLMMAGVSVSSEIIGAWEGCRCGIFKLGATRLWLERDAQGVTMDRGCC